MTAPSLPQIFAALDATWPPARFIDLGPWRLREGRGGGQRVSAATAETAVTETDIDTAETGMNGLGQRPIFMIRADDAALDAQLERRGYQVVDPVFAYSAATQDLARDLPPATTMPVWPPLAVQREIWLQGGVGPARVAVMERAVFPKAAILARKGDSPAGVAYVAVHDGIAMVHAIEVSPANRRSGVGETLLRGAANWARSEGADWLTLMVTCANVPANALYTRLSMTPVAGYHYRRAPEQKA